MSEHAIESQAAIETERFDDQEMPTAAGHQGEPSTLNRGPVTLPREMPGDVVQASPRRARANVMQLTFEDETQARAVDDHVLEKLRRETAAAQQGAPQKDPARADLAVDYESLPSLEVRRPYDSLEAAFSERDPVTQAARESAHVRRADVRKESSYNREPSYQEPSYREPAPSYPAPVDLEQEEEFWGRREGSGPRSRPVPPPPRSYAAPIPAYDDESRPWGDPPPPAPVPLAYAKTGFSSMPPAQGHYAPQEPPIPAAPRVPEEMRGQGFVMGVQPIRTATPDAWGTPHAQHGMPGQGYLPSPMQAIHAAMPPAGYGVAANQVHPHMVAASPRVANPTPYSQQQQHQQPYYPQQPQQGYPVQQRHATPMPVSGQVASASMSGRAQPVGAQLTTPPSSAGKVGRFAWFVAGAAFGITFAFFATGFFAGGRVAKEELPGAAPVAITQAAAPIAAPVAPPVAPAVMAQVAPMAGVPMAGVPMAGVPMAGVPMAGVPQTMLPSSLPNAAPQAKPAAPAAAPRFTAPRPSRPATRRSTAAKPLPGSGETEAPAPSAPAAPPSSAGGDLSDLLGAGLKP